MKLILEESQDFKYLTDLAFENKYNPLDREQLKESFKSVKHMWIGSVNNICLGVVYLSFHPVPGIWTLDGYRDDVSSLVVQRQDWSLQAAQFALDFFWRTYPDQKRIYVAYDSRDNGITRFVKRLGFEDVQTVECTVGRYYLKSLYRKD